MKDKKLQELEESFAVLMQDLKKVKADGMDQGMEDKMQYMMDALSRVYANLSDRISYLSEAFYQYTYQHQQGHIPPIKSTSMMQKALKALGMDGDYEVAKPMISVARGAKGVMSIVASYIKDEKPKV